MSTRMRALLAAVTIVLAVFGITLAVDDTNQDGRPDQVTVKVNEAAGDGQPTTTITVPEPVVDRAEEKLHDHLGSPAVPGTTQQLMNNAEQAADQIKATKPPLPTAGASPGIPGCRTRFVRNQSSRNGVRPVQHWLHYTVSPNRPGLSDVNAIVALFDRASFQASSHFVIDREGNCAYIVPLEAKSWTQAAANPWAVSYEIINSGSEATFMDSAGYAKLRLVMHEVSRRTGIPMKRGAVSACRPTVFGIVQHADGGICAGGHHDIGPF
jgi:hypothetical protein